MLEKSSYCGREPNLGGSVEVVKGVKVGKKPPIRRGVTTVNVGVYSGHNIRVVFDDRWCVG